MTITRSPAAITRHLVRTISVLAVGAALALPAAAAEPAYPAGYSRDGGDRGDGVASRRLDLSIGRSVVIDLPRDAKEVFVANPGVANAVVRSARKIFLIGVANGVTSVFVMDGEGRQIAAMEVNVGRDLSVLRQTLRNVVPTGRIDVKAAGDSILLTGVVQSAGDAQQAVDIAKAFVGQSGGATGGGPVTNPSSGSSAAAPGQNGGGTLTGGVINALTIAGRDQVMLKVSVVEMARTALKRLGVNVAGNWNIIETGANALKTISTITNPVTGIVTAPTAAFGSVGGDGGATINGQYGTRGAGVGGTLTALERAGLSRTLAEPTLVAISGESATFLAGGEIPVIINTCGGGTGTTGGCTPTVNYKKYGVSLDFSPIVLSEGRISLRVVTEVSEIDRENRDLVTGSPGFRTRRSSTTVELPSGGTMVTAGLISSQSTQTISGVPGLINLPVLGVLFRSRDFERRDTELMISVTPYIAKPMETAQVVRPDDGFVDASDPSTVLLGRLNKIYGVAGPASTKGVSGRFGFITD